MNNLVFLLSCGDGTCCCLTPRSSVVFISLISLSASIIDAFLDGSDKSCCETLQQVDYIKSSLAMLFQAANILLLLGSIVENALLLQIYIWYTLGFIVLGCVVSILDFVCRFRVEGIWSCITLIVEASFLFVTFRCLPLVDLYKKRLEGP